MRRKEIINVTNAPWSHTRWKINESSGVDWRQSTIVQCHVDWTAAHSMLIPNAQPPRRIDRRTCCSDVAQSRHVAQRIAEISVQSRQPADSRRQGNPAPNQTLHERRNSPTCSECVAQPSPVTDLGQIPIGADVQYTIQRQILSGPVYSVALEIRKSRRNAEVLFSCSTCSKLLSY